MKKIFPYVLIVIILAGYLGPMYEVYASTPLSWGQCWVGGQITGASPNMIATDCDSANGTWQQLQPQAAPVPGPPNGPKIAATPPTSTPSPVPVTLPATSSSGTCSIAPINTGPACTTAGGVWTPAPAIDPLYHFLAPLPNPNNNGAPLTTFDPTQDNQLGVYLNLMIKIFIGVCAVLAVIMIVMGGIEYMTSELISSKEAGKDRIKGALLGLLIALGAWALLNTINPNLLKSEIAIPQATGTASQANIPQAPVIVNGVATYSGQPTGTALATAYPQYSIAALPAGVSVCASNGQCGAGAQCTTVGQQNCTSTLGLDPTIVNSIENSCKTSSNVTCPLTITAGTEFWLHGVGTNHKPGSADIDFSATPDLNTYITGSSTFPSGSTKEVNGVCYYAEPAEATAVTTGSHWHAYLPANNGGQCLNT